MEQFSWSVNPVPLETRWTRSQKGTVIFKNRLLRGMTASQQMMHGQTEKDKKGIEMQELWWCGQFIT